MKVFRILGPALLASLFVGPAAAAELELKFGHVGNPGSLFEISVNEFAKRANVKLAGKAKVVAFGSSQLGKDKELLKKLKLGTVTFALPSSVMASVTDQFGLFDMPYLVKDRAHMAKIEDQVLVHYGVKKAEAEVATTDKPDAADKKAEKAAVAEAGNGRTRAAKK